MRQLVITKCDSYFITKCDKCYYKVRELLQSATVLLQSAMIITKCDRTMSVEEDEVNPATFSIQVVLLAIVFVTAIVGNGLVCCVVYHFKQLRTVPNFFIVNLSVVDLCNTLVNMPLFVGYYVIKADIFRGKWVSYVCSSLHNYVETIVRHKDGKCLACCE